MFGLIPGIAKGAIPFGKAVFGKTALMAASLSGAMSYHGVAAPTAGQTIQGLLAVGSPHHSARLLARCALPSCSPDDFAALVEALKYSIKYADARSVAEIIKSPALGGEFLTYALVDAQGVLAAAIDRLSFEKITKDDMESVLMTFKETIEIISEEIEARKAARAAEMAGVKVAGVKTDFEF
jgi:hypothetical protein